MQRVLDHLEYQGLGWFEDVRPHFTKAIADSRVDMVYWKSDVERLKGK